MALDGEMYSAAGLDRPALERAFFVLNTEASVDPALCSRLVSLISLMVILRSPCDYQFSLIINQVNPYWSLPYHTH